MDFPDFEEFKKTLTEERLSELFSGISRFQIIQADQLTSENINALVSELMHQSISASMAANLMILEAYHAWLSQEILGQS